MSAVQAYKLVCDGDGCTSVVLTPHERAHVAREEVLDGRQWTTRTVGVIGRTWRIVDLCPSCSEAPP